MATWTKGLNGVHVHNEFIHNSYLPELMRCYGCDGNENLRAPNVAAHYHNLMAI